MSGVLLLRGLTREARHWGDFPERLERAGCGKPEGVDLPGCGLARHDSSPLSIAATVEQLRARRRRGAPAQLLVAMSLGAMVATDWAQRYPNEVRGLVLINTSMRPHASFIERLRPSAWPTLLQIATNWSDADKAERAIHALTCRRDATLEADLRQWRFIRESSPVVASNALRQLTAAARYRCTPVAPRCPVLILSSASDRLVDPVCSERLASAWHARHLRHLHAGHDLPHDDADWVVRNIASFSLAPLGRGPG